MLNEYLEKLLREPLEFTDVDFTQLVAFYKRPSGKYDTDKAFNDLRECIRRIYDLNEARLKDTSNANQGLMGVLNKWSTWRRKRRYFKRTINQKNGVKYKRIYAEGDSWFQFPLFIRDIIDWLNDNKSYLIFTDAYAGDWITNILYEGQYIEALSIHDPQIFLISGGGNDLVGSNRLAVMVSGQGNQKPKYTSENLPGNLHLNEEELTLFLKSQHYITKDFYSFMWVLKAQYALLFKQLYTTSSKHCELKCITHGYAYPYPRRSMNFSLVNLLQPLVNRLVGSGKWLFTPLMIKGITDKQLQRGIMIAMIYEFNRTFIDLANDPDFPNVYHIDCRGIPKNQTDWYDELHLKSQGFRKVAELYRRVIEEDGRKLPKVITA